MQYKSQNNEHLQKMLNFYKEFYERVKDSNIRIVLYWSLSYAFFTGDENISVNDIDFIAPEKDFQKIIELVKDIEWIEYELTNHNSLRLLKNGAKLSIHSEILALEIVNFLPNLVNIEINSSKFLSLWFDDVIKFYKKWCSYEVQRKTWYTDKLNNLVAKNYENHSFFILKPSVLKRNIQDEVIDFIEKNWFEIISKKELILNDADIDYLYKEEYEKLVPILWEENSKKALEISHKLYKDKEIILLFVKWENAIEKSDNLKWNTFWPAKCNPETLRYIFRDKNFDDFQIPIWKIVEVPIDNIVHAPKTEEEFVKVAIKWLI